MKKKELAILLSKLATFTHSAISLEQYQTECEIAADCLWRAHLQGDIHNKVIADLGCGNGIFGLGALALGAKEVHFVDIDAHALAIAQNNFTFLQRTIGTSFTALFHHIDVSLFTTPVDVVFQNPPFGVQTIHADKPFLLTAMRIAPVIYTFHKIETRLFIEQFVADHHFTARHLHTYSFPLKKTAPFHSHKVHCVSVGLWRLTN